MTTREYLVSLYGDRMPLKEEQDRWKLSEIEMFHRSSLFGMSNYYHIPNKSKILVPLRPFAGQAILDLCIESQAREELPQRVAGYKSRQVGWSTWMLGKSLHRSSSSFNRRSMFLVPDEDVANVMASRLGSMIDNTPRFMQAMRRIHNVKHIVFNNPNPKDRLDNPGLNSEIQITVPSPMRGIPPDMITISEYSHMLEKDQLAVTSSILPAMGLSPYTCAVIDTTPNGDDDFYKPLIEKAVDQNRKWIKILEESPRSYTAEEILAGAIGKPDVHRGTWMVAFERWDWHEEYAIRCAQFPRGEISRKPPKKYWDAFLSDVGKNETYGGEEELDLRGKYGVQDEQLYWRRAKIDSIEMPTEDMRLATFHQEFAMSIAGGFVELDKTPFDRRCLDALRRQQRDPIMVGLFNEYEKGLNGVALQHSIATQWQEWRIYATPDPEQQYVLGVDTNQAYESLESDASAAVIMRFSDYKVVAVFTGHVPENILRRQIHLAYKWFHRPYYGIETEGMGYALVRSCIDIGMHNYYAWKRLDRAMPEPTEYPGWQTDNRTRPYMDSKFIENLCHFDPETKKPTPKFNIPDKESIDQICSIRRGDSGSLKHSHGKDDLFDAICICLCLMEDPYGGFHSKKDREAEEQVRKREEFELLFKKALPQSTIRNKPSLANL